MIRLDIAVDARHDFAVYIRGIAPKLIRGVAGITRQNAKDFHLEMLRMMLDDPKTGRYYVKPGGRIHQASAPGESPAFDTGNLANSLMIRGGDGGLQQLIYTKAFYAAWLEDGTDNGLAPRPWWEPALDRQKEIYFSQLKTFIQGGF